MDSGTRLDEKLKNLGFETKYKSLEPGITLEKDGKVIDKFLTEHEIFVWLCGYEAKRTIDWQALHSRFKALENTTGRDKSSSYCMNISFSVEDGITVYLGCYDVGSWPRNVELGPFKDEAEAFEATSKKVDEAYEEVKTYRQRDPNPNLDCFFGPSKV